MKNGSRITGLLIAWMAVTAVILTTACTKGGGGSQPPAQAAAPQSTPAPTGTGGELDTGSGNSSQTGSTPAPDANGTIVIYDPTGLNPDQIYSSSEQQGSAGDIDGVLSNLTNPDGSALVYSGAGQDSLRQELKAIVNAEQDPAQREANLSLAAELSNANFRFDDYSHTLTVSLIQSQNGRRSLIKGHPTRVDHNGIARFGMGNWIIDAACMDLNGSCSTVHLKIQDRQYGRVRTAHMIARRTLATLFTQGNGYGVSHNEEYDRLLAIMLNTVTNPGSVESVKKLVLATSETINGASTFTVTMMVLRGHQSSSRVALQDIIFNGALVKAPGSSVSNAPVRQEPSVLSVDGRVISDPSLKYEAIQDVRLVRNDGRGNIQLELNVRAISPGSQQDKLLITVARIHKQVRSTVLR